MTENPPMEELRGEKCPMCMQDTLVLRQMEKIIPHFGPAIIFSMRCEAEECDFYQRDIESLEEKEAVKQSYKVTSEEDLQIRVIKGSNAKVKLGRVGSINPVESSSGYITTIEGLIKRMKTIVEGVRDSASDKKKRNKAKRQVKKLQKVLWGRDTLNITIEDPTGNSKILLENK